ncbi:MAG: hypothetical protein EZS28_054521, partial [Streblomastix strix]
KLFNVNASSVAKYDLGIERDFYHAWKADKQGRQIDLNNIALEILNKDKKLNQKKEEIDRQFGYNFVRRNKNLKFGYPEQLDNYRARNCTKQVLAPFYKLIGEKVIAKLPLPQMIGNLDEASISQIMQDRRLVVSMLDDNSYAQPDVQKGLIGASIVPFITADGSYFPYCVLLNSAKVPKELV